MKSLQIALSMALLMGVLASCSKTETTTPVAPPANEKVSGDVSGTWTKDGTYTVTNHIQIPAGKTLTIEEGANVIFADSTIKPEFIVRGNMYVLGTATNPVKLTVPDSYKSNKYRFGRLWGGIICANTCEELLLQYATIEYGGAVSTDASPSVKAGLYKAAAGNADPVINYANVNGRFVMQNCTINNFAEDGIYVEGGKVILSNNTIYTTGDAGGDAINIKSGVLADVAFNVIYSPNTNAIKLSNVGDRVPQIHVIAYNNTIVNAGWRRPTIKGGSIWVEAGVRADIINNLLINNRFGVKRDVKNPEDTRSTVSNNYYYGYTQTAVTQFQPTTEILKGTNDIIGTKAGDNDPKLVNFPLDNATSNPDFTTTWDFSLQASSPALGKGKTDFTRHHTAGLMLGGKSYASPAPTTYVGAKGLK